MAITKINNVLVKHGRIMFAVFTAVIIVSFVWFFTPGTSGSILFDRNPNSPNAVCGEIFGTKIKNKDVNHAINSMTLVQAMMYNQQPNQAMFNVSYEQAFIIAAANAAAKHLGVVVSDEEVAKMIRESATFKKDGKFSGEAYIKYEKEKLQPAGFNAADLEDAVRLQLTVTSLSKLIGEQPVVSPAELNEFLKTNLEKYDVLSITFQKNNFKAGIPASAADLQAYYNNNKNQFMVPEKFKAEAVVFPYAIYAGKAAPKAAEIKAYYDANKDSFKKGDKVQSLAEATAAVTKILKEKKMKEFALAAATQFREKIYDATSNIAGDKKAYLAEYRKIAAKYPKKVQINWFTADAAALPGVGKDAALQQALVTQSRSNVPVTDPVVGVNGVYVAAVNDYQASKPAEFAAVQADVKAKFIDQKALAKANEAMRTFAAAMVSVKNADAKKIQSLAKGAMVKRYESFSLYPGTDKVPSEIVMIASGTATGKLSETLPMNDGPMAVYVMKRTVPAAKEMETHKATLSMYYNYAKMDAISSALFDWINKNTKNYISQQQ